MAGHQERSGIAIRLSAQDMLIGGLSLPLRIYFQPTRYRQEIADLAPDLPRNYSIWRARQKLHDPGFSRSLVQLSFQALVGMTWGVTLTLLLGLLGIPINWGGVAGGVVAGVVLGVALSVTGGIAFGVAAGVATAVAGAVAFGIATSVATTVAGDVAGGVAGGVAMGMAFGAAFGVVRGMAASVGWGVWMRVMGNAAGSVTGGGVGVLISAHVLLLLPQCLLSAASPILLGIFPSLGSLLWRISPVRWDEVILLPLPGLVGFLVDLSRTDPALGRSAINEVAAHRFQRRAAWQALIQLAGESAQSVSSLDALAAYSRELAWLSEEVRISTETRAVLLQMRDISTEVNSALQSDSMTNRARRLREAVRIAEQRRLAPGTFGAILARWSAILAAGLKAAQQEQEAREPIPQAYIQDGRPIRPEYGETFKGRSKQFAEMELALGGSGQHPTFLLYGQRRSGKTSMLFQLPKRLGSKVIPAFVDLQDAGNAESAAGIIGRIVEIVGNESLMRRQVSLPGINAQTLAVDPYAALGRWLDQIEQALEDRTLLLNLDEFETLEKAIERGRLDERILGAIRNIMQHRHRVVVLLSGSHRIEELPPRWPSALVTTKIIEVSFLEHEAAKELITKPTTDFPSIYTPEAVDKIIELTHCHPHLIQVTCGHLVEHMNRMRRMPPDSYVTIEDVETVIPQIFTSASNYFSDQWRTETGSKVGQHVLEKLAAASGTELSREAIRQVERDEAALRKAIETLLNREMIERSASGTGYRITVPLFAEYVRREMLN